MDAPVERVSWEDCQRFLTELSLGFRLPTEEEWEYAVQAEPMQIGVDDAGRAKPIFADPAMTAAFVDIGFDFLMYHIRRSDDTERRWTGRAGKRRMNVASYCASCNGVQIN